MATTGGTADPLVPKVRPRVDLVIALSGELTFAVNENAGFSAINHEMDRSRMVPGDVVLGLILRTADVRFNYHESFRQKRPSTSFRHACPTSVPRMDGRQGNP